MEWYKRVICDAVTAYCSAPSRDRFNFEKIVRKNKLVASFLRKKDKVLEKIESISNIHSEQLKIIKEKKSYFVVKVVTK